MNHRISIFFSIFLLFAAAEARVVKVGAQHFEPYISASDTDNGLFAEFLNCLAAENNWQLQYIAAQSAELTPMLVNGELDIICAIPYNRESKGELDFNRESLISTWGAFYSVKKMELKSLIDTDEKVVGVLQDDPYGKEYQSLVNHLKFDVTIIEFKSGQLMLEALEEGWIDLALLDRFFGAMHKHEQKLLSHPVIIAPSDLRFVVSSGKNSDLLEAIDRGMLQRRSNPESEYSQRVQALMELENDEKLPVYIYWLILIVLAVIAFLVAAIRLMKGQIHSQTESLRQKNEELKKEIKNRHNITLALEHTKSILEKTINNMQDGLLIISPEIDILITQNHALEKLFGYSEQETLRMLKVRFWENERELWKKVKQSIQKKGFFQNEIELQRKDGRFIPCEVYVSEIEHIENSRLWIIVVKDITERIHLRQAQKMEAIGTLAGGIAHDFNNMLTPIIGYSQIVKMSLPDDSDLQAYLDQIVTVSERAKELVSQILAFSRKSELKRKPLKIIPLVKETLKLLRSSIPVTVEISDSYNIENDHVLANPTQMHQILMNLCTNAAQAMENKNKGKLSVAIYEHHGPIRSWTITTRQTDGYCVLYPRIMIGMDARLSDGVLSPFLLQKQRVKVRMGSLSFTASFKNYGGMIP